MPTAESPIRTTIEVDKLLVNQLYAGIQNGRHDKNSSAALEKCKFWEYFFKKNAALEANRLGPRSGPTYVGPDLGSSLFAILKITKFKSNFEETLKQSAGDITGWGQDQVPHMWDLILAPGCLHLYIKKILINQYPV